MSYSRMREQPGKGQQMKAHRGFLSAAGLSATLCARGSSTDLQRRTGQEHGPRNRPHHARSHPFSHRRRSLRRLLEERIVLCTCPAEHIIILHIDVLLQIESVTKLTWQCASTQNNCGPPACLAVLTGEVPKLLAVEPVINDSEKRSPLLRSCQSFNLPNISND